MKVQNVLANFIIGIASTVVVETRNGYRWNGLCLHLELKQLSFPIILQP